MFMACENSVYRGYSCDHLTTCILSATSLSIWHEDKVCLYVYMSKVKYTFYLS